MPRINQQGDALANLIDKMFVCLANNYITYYDSIENYQANKTPSTKRKLIFYLYFITLFISIIQMIVLMNTKDIDMLVELGEYMFLFNTRYKLVYGYQLSVFIMILMFK